MMDIPLAKKLLALAVDRGTSEEERRTAAVKLAKWLHETSLIEYTEKMLGATG